MTSEEFYTYAPAYETTLYGNKGGGVTVEQCDAGDRQLIYLTTHQARWLADRLIRIADEIESAEVDSGGAEDGDS